MHVDRIENCESQQCEAGRVVLHQVMVFCGLLLLTVLLSACVSAEYCRDVLAKSGAAAKSADSRQSGKGKVVKPTAAAVDAKPEQDPMPGEDQARQTARQIATGLARACPLSAPDDLAAFDGCRKALAGGSTLRQRLSERTLWGPQSKDLAKSLKDSGLSQVSADALADTYIPLFMFSGKHAVAWSENEKLWRIELAATFRGRLQRDQLPASHQHQDDTWRHYEGANAVLLWIDPATTRITHAQVSQRGLRPQSFALEPGTPELAGSATRQRETAIGPQHADPPEGGRLTAPSAPN